MITTDQWIDGELIKKEDGYYIEGERPIEGTKATEIYSKKIKPRIR